MPDLDLSTIREAFKGDLVTPDQPSYAVAISRWASNAERQAAVVAFVKNNADVVLAIAFARASGLPIAVRCGGHSSAGASSTEGGLVIDLSRYMTQVTVNPAEKLAYVAGGATWEIVNRATMAHDLATVGGTVNHTGVGGLTLGGGYGWLTSEHGLVIDNLIQATIVSADGTILTASSEENPDLFFGIRGGGGNFGVVTQFVYKLMPQQKHVYAGALVFPISRRARIVEATNAWWKIAGAREGIFVVFTTDQNGEPIITSFVFYNGSEVEGRANFKWLLDIGPINDMTKGCTYEEANSLQNFHFCHGKGTYWSGMTLKNMQLASLEVAHEKLSEASKIGAIKELEIAFQLLPLHVVNSVPVGATAFRRSSLNNTFDVLFSLRWDQKEGDQTNNAHKLIGELKDILGGPHTGLTTAEKLGYGNHDFEDSTIIKEGNVTGNKAKLLFGENYPRLQQVKKQYDPDNIFNKWFSIDPVD